MPNKSYKYIYDPRHQKALNDGCVYEHVIIAEKILGRPLSSEEVIHHKDENRKNNDPSNIMVFRTNEDHSRYHKQKSGLREMGDKTYTCDKIKTLCEVCNKPIANKYSSLCEYCYKIKKSEHLPSKETLEKLVWEIPSTHIGKLYNVSSKAVEKWCKKYGISKPPRGYWTKKMEKCPSWLKGTVC